MKTLFYNGCSHAIVRADMNLNDAVDTFYLVMVPWFQLHARNVESFQRDGERTVIGLEGNAVIDINWNTKTYSAALNRSPICSEAGTFCPLDENRIAFYSPSSRELSAQLPQGWEAQELRAARLTPTGREDFHIRVEGSQIRANVEAQQPVIVYKNDAARRRSRAAAS